MRLARKLFLLVAVAAAGLALAAASASAQVHVSPEVPSSPPCGTVTLGAGHVVSGGCHFEFRSEPGDTGVALHLYIPAKTTIMSCTWHFEGYVGEGGEGYFTAMSLTAPSGGSTPCTRTACDEANGTQIPWPFHVVEHGPLNEELEMVLCLRPSSNPAGTAGTPCELHFELTENADHVYELGHGDGTNGTEVFCENNPPNVTGHPTLPFPVSFEPHLVTSGEERVEINHDL